MLKEAPALGVVFVKRKRYVGKRRTAIEQTLGKTFMNNVFGMPKKDENGLFLWPVFNSKSFADFISLRSERPMRINIIGVNPETGVDAARPEETNLCAIAMFCPSSGVRYAETMMPKESLKELIDNLIDFHNSLNNTIP